MIHSTSVTRLMGQASNALHVNALHRKLKKCQFAFMEIIEIYIKQNWVLMKVHSHIQEIKISL